MVASLGVLIIDDDAAIQRALTASLATNYSVHVASSGEEGLREFERVRPDVVLLDVMLPQMSGLAVLRALKRQSAELPVIMMTAYSEVQTAVQAIKLGASDYLQKPVNPQCVLDGVAGLIDRGSKKQAGLSENVIGQSVAMKRVWRAIERFGPTDIPILVQGETGTGKGLIAQAIHQISKRARAEFVGIDCATIPEQLAESELFGYEDGAFTGAGKKKRGRVAFADRGTLFLDEIGTLSLATQAKLLTLLEQQAFLPLGSRDAQPMHLDVRFISATNVPLQRAVEQNIFRADLFHRLNGVMIELPPLREREGDIALLAHHFVDEWCRRQRKPALTIADDAIQAMQRYAWPGNVRELHRVLSVAVVTASEAVTADDLPDHVRDSTRVPPVEAVAPSLPLHSDWVPDGGDSGPINLRDIKEWAGREAQKRVIQELQRRTNITQQELARVLGVDPKTLRSRLKEISGEPRPN
jgi:two-component system, NtrC family, nitrogen regulation response regulator NtrX